ncbi:MAG: tetratricopeptide repeat protein [Chthoniobacterales bacterium]|nr:tetratricopeptide repeat protein [Chthoniobacterales bacterium]
MRTLPIIWAAIIALSATGRAANPAVEKAQNALRDGLPKAAIAPLEEAIRKSPAGERNSLGLLLARAQLDAGLPGEALRTLDEYCDKDSSQAAVLRAAALAAQGKLEAAAKLVSPLAPASADAKLLLARIRLQQGDRVAASAALPGENETPPSEPDALRLLIDLQLQLGNWGDAQSLIDLAKADSLLPAAELDVAAGRVLLAQDQPSGASELFRAVLESGDLPGPVRDNARLGLARSLTALGVDNRARDVLRETITSNPDTPTMRESMERWITLSRKAGEDPSANLREWAAQKDSRRTTEARLQLARSEIDAKRAESAIALLGQVKTGEEISAEDSLRSKLLLAEAQIATGQTGEARAILDDLDASAAGSDFSVADLRGRAFAATGDHRKAYESFQEALKRARTPEETSAAAANAMLAALASNDTALARASYEVLRKTAPADPSLLRWSFLLATAEAREGNIDSLAALAGRSAAAEYAFQAKLALAEWRLARGEPAAAERILGTARQEADVPDRASALAAAEIFAADSAGSKPREELVKACEAFLTEHGSSPEALDIRFKLAELHSRAGDHAAAESILSGIARSQPDAETAALAKFLAAQAASRSMSAEGAGRALAWYDELAQSSSPLRYRARFEQASLLLRDQQFTDAQKLYDRLLASDPPPEVRQAALMEKGDTLFALAAQDPAKLSEAAEVYAKVSADLSAPPDWRDQAACKRAAVLARAGRATEALAAYHDVLSKPPQQSADLFWFYKAGLEAARLLEEQKDWPAAIAVYDQLAAVKGPQREELAQRARRLRLEHFIWEN